MIQYAKENIMEGMRSMLLSQLSELLQKFPNTNIADILLKYFHDILQILRISILKPYDFSFLLFAWKLL